MISYQKIKTQSSMSLKGNRITWTNKGATNVIESWKPNFYWVNITDDRYRLSTGFVVSYYRTKGSFMVRLIKPYYLGAPAPSLRNKKVQVKITYCELNHELSGTLRQSARPHSSSSSCSTKKKRARAFLEKAALMEDAKRKLQKVIAEYDKIIRKWRKKAEEVKSDDDEETDEDPIDLM